MPRTYGTTNIAPYSAAPAVGPAGDTYYNTGNKALYISDGTQWNAIQAGGGGGGAPYAPVTGTSPPPSTPTISPPTGLLWVDTSTTPSWTPSAGPGVPAGGTSGQYLRKRSNTDYDTQWFGPANLIFYQTIPALTPAMSPYAVPHNLGTQYVQVQMWDSVTGLLVQAQVQVVNVNTVQVSVTQAMPNSVNVVVMGTPNLATPVNPADIASKSYVDARTPNLPSPVTSGTTIQSYTDVLGCVWIAKNGVNSGNWFRAREVLHGSVYLTGTFALTTNQTVMSWDTISRDAYGMWGTAAPYGTCTLPFPGLYRVEAQLSCNQPTVGNQVGIWAWLGAGYSINIFLAAQENASTTGFGGINCLPTASKTVYVGAGNLAVVFQQRASTAVNATAGTSMTWAAVTYVGTG